MKHFSRFLFCTLLLLFTWQLAPCQSLQKPPIVPLNRPGEDADFQRYLRSGRISVVTFYADWCPSCRRWAPILGFAHGMFPDMQVLLMDIGEWDTPVTQKYGIESVPHFKIYDGDGNLVIQGPAASDWLRSAIERRVQASASGNYRLNTQVPVDLNNATRSVTTRPKTRADARGRTSLAALNTRAKIDSTGPLLTLDQVLDRYVKAVGGAELAERFRTRMVKGKITISKLGRGSFESYFKAPNKVSTTINIPEVGLIKQGFDGSSGWSLDPRRGIRAASKVQLATMRRDADFQSWVNLRDRYAEMKVLGVSKIGYREVYVVEAQSPGNSPELLYFSKDNGLLIRWDLVMEATGVQAPAEIYLDDWTAVDGLTMPLTITQLFPHGSIVLNFDEVKHDVEVSDLVFNRPRTK